VWPFLIVLEGEMKIGLDQRSCNCWDAACEAHFSWHFLGEEITPVDCVIETVDDDRPELTFYIKDRDGSDKTLVIDDTNRGEAYNSWRQAWEKQAG
jgi:hypothetical protein